MSRIYDRLRKAQGRAAPPIAAGEQQRPCRVVTVTSNKGGVGKTTIATNLAIYLRALSEDEPVLVFGLDDQPLVDRMFAFEPAPPKEDLLGALRAGSLSSAVNLGQYGVHYVASSADIAELKQEIDRPSHLQEVLARSDWRGTVIIDTKSDLEILTRNAIAASDLAIVVVSDQASLAEARKVFELLDAWGLPRTRARILLSMVDLRIKYREAEAQDVLSLLLSEIRALGYPLFETFVSRSPKIEALYTNPEGRAHSILHQAPGSLIHEQMRHLADDVARTLCQLPPPPVAADAAAAPAVWLRGLTLQARAAIPVERLRIDAFPFRIGRLDPEVRNDLAVPDDLPWQVSRRHVEIVERDGRIGVLDLGSRLGCLIDGRRLPGPDARPGPVFFPASGGTLILGGETSPYRYEVVIER